MTTALCLLGDSGLPSAARCAFWLPRMRPLASGTFLLCRSCRQQSLPALEVVEVGDRSASLSLAGFLSASPRAANRSPQAPSDGQGSAVASRGAARRTKRKCPEQAAASGVTLPSTSRGDLVLQTNRISLELQITACSWYYR
jgi:hypothetical protein